jgi:hypothetical protein
VLLRPDVHRELRAALEDALQEGDLRALLRDLGQRSGSVIPASATLREQIGDLIEWAERNDRVVDLVVAARERNRDNGKLREFTQAHFHKPLTDNGRVVSEPHPVDAPRPAEPARTRQRGLLRAGVCMVLLLGVASLLVWAGWGIHCLWGRGRPELERALEEMRICSHLDSDVVKAWGDKADLAYKWQKVTGPNERLFRVVQLGPLQADLDEQTIEFLIGMDCEAWFQVFRRKRGASKVHPCGEVTGDTNPARIELPVCAPGDTLFILLSIRNKVHPRGGIRPRSEKDWHNLIHVRSLP